MLNDKIQRASSFGTMARLLLRQHAGMDAVHLTALSAKLVGALRPTPPRNPSGVAAVASMAAREKMRAVLQTLAAAATVDAVTRKMRPRQCAGIIWALGKLCAASRAQEGRHEEVLEHPMAGLLGYEGESEAMYGSASSSSPHAAAAAAATAVLMRRLDHTLGEASGRDIAQALYGAALQAPHFRCRRLPCHSASGRRLGFAEEDEGEEGWPLNTQHSPFMPAMDSAGESHQEGDEALHLRLVAHLQAALPSCRPQDLSMSV